MSRHRWGLLSIEVKAFDQKIENQQNNRKENEVKLKTEEEGRIN